MNRQLVGTFILALVAAGCGGPSPPVPPASLVTPTPGPTPSAVPSSVTGSTPSPAPTGSLAAPSPSPSPSYQSAPHLLYEQTPLAAFPAGRLRQVVVSPDRRQVAFSLAEEPNRVYLAPVGGAPGSARALESEVKGVFQWQGDGQTLVYVERLFKAFPGEFIDLGVPKTETLGYRVVRLPLAGGPPVVLAAYPPGTEAPVILANPRTDQVVHTTGGRTAGPLWLVGGSAPDAIKLYDGVAHTNLTWSPDGARLAYEARDPRGELPTEVRMIDVTNSQSRAVRAEGTVLTWAATSDQLHVVRVENPSANPGPARLRVSTLSFWNDEVVERQAELRHPETGMYYNSLYPVWPSPDGARILGVATAGQVQGDTVVISLERLDVTILGAPVPLRGWLDDERIIYGELRGHAPGIMTARVPRDVAAGLLPVAAMPRPVGTFVDLVAPREGKVGQPVPVTLSFLVDNACETPTAAYASLLDPIRMVTFSGLIARRTNVGTCPADRRFPTLTTTFTPRSVGAYRLKIRVSPRFAQGAAAADLKSRYDESVLSMLEATDVTFVVNVTD